MITIDLTRERLDYADTSVAAITDDGSIWRGTVRVHLAVEGAPSITLYLIPEDAAFLAALLEELS